MMALTDVRGRFLWYDLMTTDPQGAHAFYAKVAGWGLQRFGDTEPPYMMFARGGAPLGGCMQLPEEASKMGAPSHWIGYIGTPDLDDTYATAVKLGARTYVPPRDIPTVGKFAVIADPQGATIAFFTPLNEQPPSHPPEVGDVSWHELTTTDPDAALRFYQQLAAWEQTGSHDMGPMGTYHMFGREGHTLGGMFKKPEDMPAPSHWTVYIRVPDIQTGAGAVKGNGGQVLMGPHQVPGGDWIVICTDPQGAVFALHQRKAA
jgi:predicted enzyme related to lactoylglutathione lyase